MEKKCLHALFVATRKKRKRNKKAPDKLPGAQVSTLAFCIFNIRIS